MQLRSDTRGLCEEAWRTGMPLKVTADGFPISMKPSMNCEYKVKGANDVAFVGFPDLPKDALVAHIRAFLTTIPRLSAEDLESLGEDGEGVYTWIYASTDGSEPTFYASRTTAMLELGTVHYSIATAVGATAVHGAGELWKHGGEYTFNFLSGTFMEKWKLPERCTLDIMEEVLKEKLKTTFAYLRREKALTFQELQTTYVSPRFLTLTTAELQSYVEEGFKVCIHGYDGTEEDRTRAHTQCKATKATCKNPVTLETMRGGTLPSRDRPTPRTARLQGVPYVPPALPQINEARRMLTFGEATREAPTAPPRVPTSKLPGMGGRKTKTRKTKLHRRTTRRRRRGGADEDLDPTHIGVRMADSLLAEPPHRTLSASAPAYAPPGPDPPEFQMFDELAEELRLTPKQRAYMVGTFYDARERKIELPKDRLRKHLKAVYKL